MELGLKDVALVREAAAKAGAPMPFASLLHDRLLAARQRGRGEAGGQEEGALEWRGEGGPEGKEEGRRLGGG